MQYQR